MSSHVFTRESRVAPVLDKTFSEAIKSGDRSLWSKTLSSNDTR